MHRVVCVVMKRKSCQLGRKDQHPHIYTYVYSHIVVTYMYIKICMWGGATVHPTGGEEAYVGSAGTVVCGASSAGLLLLCQEHPCCAHICMHGWEEAQVGSASTIACGASSKGYAPLPIRSISFYIYTCVYIYIYI